MAAAHSLGLPGSLEVVNGPSSRATVIGPDGSAINSFAPGGRIIAETNPGFVARTAPAIAAPVPALYSAPTLYNAGIAAPAFYNAGYYGRASYAAPGYFGRAAYAAPGFGYNHGGSIFGYRGLY